MRPTARPERRGISKARPIQAAKEAIATIDLADRLCGPGQMRRVGKTWVARCPLPDHEDRSPSFTVYTASNSWFCYGCLRGGDVIELARFGWGYDNSEVGTAAAMLLMEYGHELPERPLSWFRRKERQKPIKDAIDEARAKVMMLRLSRWIIEPILADIEDPDERVQVGNELWATVRPLAVRLVEDRKGTA